MGTSPAPLVHERPPAVPSGLGRGTKAKRKRSRSRRVRPLPSVSQWAMASTGRAAGSAGCMVAPTRTASAAGPVDSSAWIGRPSAVRPISRTSKRPEAARVSMSSWISRRPG